MNPYRRTNEHGLDECSDGTCWFSERYVCQHCAEDREAAGLPYRFADDQYSFGCYAGRYCEECWPRSGYRDAPDPEAEFDPSEAGERIEEE